MTNTARRWVTESLLQNTGEQGTPIPEITGDSGEFTVEWDAGPMNWDVIALEEVPDGFAAKKTSDGRVRYFRLKGISDAPNS